MPEGAGARLGAGEVPGAGARLGAGEGVACAIANGFTAADGFTSGAVIASAMASTDGCLPVEVMSLAPIVSGVTVVKEATTLDSVGLTAADFGVLWLAGSEVTVVSNSERGCGSSLLDAAWGWLGAGSEIPGGILLRTTRTPTPITNK
jgi:hypothetical protein